jgi:hypothetical protein
MRRLTSNKQKWRRREREDGRRKAENEKSEVRNQKREAQGVRQRMGEGRGKRRDEKLETGGHARET